MGHVQDEVAQLLREVSPAAQELIAEIYALEQSVLHIGSPHGVEDSIVRKVKGVIK